MGKRNGSARREWLALTTVVMHAGGLALSATARRVTTAHSAPLIGYRRRYQRAAATADCPSAASVSPRGARACLVFVRRYVAGLAFVLQFGTVLLPVSAAQTRIDVTSYLGGYVPTADLATSSYVLSRGGCNGYSHDTYRQQSAFAAGARVTLWRTSKLGFEGTVG